MGESTLARAGPRPENQAAVRNRGALCRACVFSLGWQVSEVAAEPRVVEVSLHFSSSEGVPLADVMPQAGAFRQIELGSSHANLSSGLEALGTCVLLTFV